MKGKMNRIVVMGGSFNPPTLAHYKLMKVAIDTLKADVGLFVPVSDAYLKRKMRYSHPPVVLSPDLRVRMLKTMCTDNRMAVCEMEIGTVEPRTMPTLMALQKDYPDAELYFLIGDDKLNLLSHLTAKSQFLDLFKVGLYSREDDTLKQSLQRHAVLSDYLDRIVILPQSDGTDGISSSLVRERMLNGESCQTLLSNGVWELFKEFTPLDFPDTINQFKNEYSFLSNLFPCRFVWQGLTYENAEAAFQSSKCKNVAERKVYVRCSPVKAVLKGKEQIPYTGWEDERMEIMESILKAKFEQNIALMGKLINTRDFVLINGNNKKDTFWGVDLYSWQGENQLGRILMNIRDKEVIR